jgi:hypothetical protein
MADQTSHRAIAVAPTRATLPGASRHGRAGEPAVEIALALHHHMRMGGSFASHNIPAGSAHCRALM